MQKDCEHKWEYFEKERNGKFAITYTLYYRECLACGKIERWVPRQKPGGQSVN